MLACVFSALCLLLVASAAYDDVQIDSHRGTTVADVLSVDFNRTAVRFVTPDGTVVIPSGGVLYPSGLTAGDEVRVEYDTLNTELVKVQGRNFTLSFLPVGMSLAICWAIVGPAVWLLRRDNGEDDGADDGADDADRDVDGRRWIRLTARRSTN